MTYTELLMPQGNRTRAPVRKQEMMFEPLAQCAITEIAFSFCNKKKINNKKLIINQ